MKKCASCSKDLPDAALHCVFCGAKQPPTQAPQGLAKTVMGYSASEMIEQMKQGPSTKPGPAAAPPQPPPPAFQPPPSRPQPPPARPQPAPMAEPPRFTGNNAPTAYAPPGAFATNPSPAVRPVGSNEPTMYANNNAPAPSFQQPAPMGPGPGPSMGGPMARSGPAPVAPMPHNMAPAPAAQPPYLASQTHARAGRAIEPWKDSLRFQMFTWGAVLLAVFAVPLAIDPLIGNWTIIADGDGVAKLPPLVMASVGLLAIVIASIPMSPAPRGLIASLLGLTGLVTPLIIGLIVGAPFRWQLFVELLVPLALVPGLLVRQEYRDALLPRLLVTIGVIAALLPFVIPLNGEVLLVDLFKALLDVDGIKPMVALIILLLQIVIVVLCLLVWLPAPSSAMGKVLAWLLILWPLVLHVTGLLLDADTIVEHIKAEPNAVLFGTAGPSGHAVGESWAIVGAYTAIVSYGLATVFGKQLE